MLNLRQDSGSTSQKVFLALCLLIIAILLLHIGFLENKFIDGRDLTRIVQNPLIRNIGPEGFVRDVKGFYAYGYPSFLATYFWGLVFAIWELNHIGFHFVSFLLHALCAGLLFLLLIRVAGKILPAFTAALIFGLHPLHCETVNWISRQDMMLAVFFGLAYLHLSLWKGRSAGILSAFLLLVAIGFSPVSILFLPAKFILKGRESEEPLWRGMLLPLMAWLAVWGVKIFFVSLETLVTRAPGAVYWFLRDLFMPWKIHFMLPHLSGGFRLPWVVSLALIGVTGRVAWKTRSKALGALFLVFVSLTLLHLDSGRFNGGVTYFPLLFLSVALGTGLSGIQISSPFLKAGAAVLVVAILAAFAWISYARNKAWRNTRYLLTDALKAVPADGWFLATLGHYEAAFLNRKAAGKYLHRVKKEIPETLCLEAKATHLLLDTAESEDLFEKLFSSYPRMEKNKYCLFDFAVLHIQTSKTDDAEKLLRKVVRLDPYFIYAWHDLGTLYLKGGKEKNGIACLRKALEVAPAYRPTLENMAYFYAKSGKAEKASSYLRTAFKSTSCHDTRRFYRKWLKALREGKAFPFASLQWADLKPPG